MKKEYTKPATMVVRLNTTALLKNGSHVDSIIPTNEDIEISKDIDPGHGPGRSRRRMDWDDEEDEELW